jgi:hypothetical protein
MRYAKNSYWFEQSPGTIVTMSDGTQYKVKQEGWRKVKEKDSKKPVK